MNVRRTIWSEAHGPIPKGWVVHNLNGQPGDVRLENLAAVPRDSIFLAVASLQGANTKLRATAQTSR